MNENVTCLQTKYGEFGDLLFKTLENGITYFDATNYILARGDIRKHSIKSFELGFTHWISAICDAYEADRKGMIIEDEKTGHFLIDESLALLFVAYIDPDFGVYMLERISEMLTNGIVISDTYLLLQLRQRFTGNELSKLIDDEKK